MDDKDREYTFEVLQNNNVVGNLTLKDGESGEITINAGDYEVKPTNETPEPFHMTYTDSASVNGPAEGNPSAAIKFSNVFTAGDGGYRYIHEYYFKDKDGKYRYEGSSDMTYVRGRPLTESYQSLDIDLKPFFSINGSSYEYTHFGDGYGIVDVGDSRNKAPGTYADLSADTTEETDEDGTTTTASETEDEEETDTGEETDTTESSPGSTDQTDESDGETPSQTDTAETETETQTLTNPGESEVENPSQPAGTEAGEKDQSQSDAGESEPKDQPQTIPLETAEENRTQDAHREFMEENGAAADAQSPDPGMHLFAHTAVTEIDRQTSTDTG